MSSPAASFRGTFAPLRHRDFRLYFGGQGLSLIGTFMQQVAAQWLVWELTRDARYLGLASALAFLPMLILGPVTSALADRAERRRILIVTQTVDMLLAFALCGLVVGGVQEVWPVLVLLALLGASSAFTVPAQTAFIGDLSGISEVRAAFTLYGMVIETARLVGPAIAGQLIALVGSAWAFGLNGLSFVAVIISLLAVKAAQRRIETRANPLADFAASARYMASQPRIVDLLACRIAVMLFIFGSLQLCAPIADEILRGGAALAGTLLSASGAGALVGALAVAPQVRNARRPGVVMAGLLGWSGVWLMATSFVSTPAAAIGGVFLYSVSIPVVLTQVSALTQVLAPGGMRARLGGAQQMVSSAMQPVGALAVGWLASALGPLPALRVAGALMAVTAVAMLVLRSGFRRWTMEPENPQGETA